MTKRTDPQPTGYKESRGDAAYVVFTRTFHAPIEDVWAAVTEPDRLGRWIGTWTGDPASGQVDFLMTAEGAVAVPVDSVGPGWDFYLDRLVTAESGGDVSALDFDDYYPAFSDHYREAFA